MLPRQNLNVCSPESDVEFWIEKHIAVVLNQSTNNEEVNIMKRFLKDARELYDIHNIGIKEYFFE